MKMKEFRGPNGVSWGVQVTSPGASNAMVVFHHPDGKSSHKDRYAWFISAGPEARNVSARLDPANVLEMLDDHALARLFRRSMPVSTPHGEPATTSA